MLDFGKGKRNGKTIRCDFDMMKSDAEVVTLSFRADECTIDSNDREVKWYCEKRIDEQ